MRSGNLALILAVAVTPLTVRQAAAIQQRPDSTNRAAAKASSEATKSITAEAPDSATVRLSKTAVDSLTELVAHFRRDPEAVALPPNDQIAMGGRSIAAGTQVAGPVAVAGGP